MRSVLALLLCVSLLTPACAVRSSSLEPRAGFGAAGQSGEIPRAYVEQLPVGRDVEVRLRGGERFKGTYMGLEGESIRVQPSTRIPVPPRVVPLADLVQLRLAPGGNGGSVAKAVLIGAATGAGVFFGLLLIAIASSGS